MFCFGTRLTHVTAALRKPDGDMALDLVGGLVADLDGGTRIGPALLALTEQARHRGKIRGATTLVLSDGLERGDTAAMAQAVGRLARICHRVVWLTPLAGNARYQPRTRGMAAILPWLDWLGDGSSLAAVADATRRLRAIAKRPRGGAEQKFLDGGARP